jgi:hypothetical protein
MASDAQSGPPVKCPDPDHSDLVHLWWLVEGVDLYRSLVSGLDLHENCSTLGMFL